MTFESWSLFFIMETALSLSPGPAVFYVVSQGIRGLPRVPVATLGILSANVLYFALSATSLGALIATSAHFFLMAKWLGAGYLIYLGAKSLLASGAGRAVALDSTSASLRTPMKLEQKQVYLGALTLQLSNPKALLFFLAVLPQFIDTHRAVVPQMVILATTSILPEFGILSGYGWLAHRAAGASSRFGVTGGMNRWLSRVEGVGLLICATLVLRFSRSA